MHYLLIDSNYLFNEGLSRNMDCKPWMDPTPKRNLIFESQIPPTHGRGGGWGGGCPSPSIQKPIPSPRAENQGPSKNVWPKKGKSAFLEKISLFCDSCTERQDPYFV